jgi:hypothetical protein
MAWFTGHCRATLYRCLCTTKSLCLRCFFVLVISLYVPPVIWK